MKTKWIHHKKTVNHNTNVKYTRHNGLRSCLPHSFRKLLQNEIASQSSIMYNSQFGGDAYITTNDYVGAYHVSVTANHKFWWFNSVDGDPYLNRLHFIESSTSLSTYYDASLFDGALASRVVGYLVKLGVIPTNAQAIVCNSMGVGVPSDHFFIWYSMNASNQNQHKTLIFPMDVEGSSAYDAWTSSPINCGSWTGSYFVSKQSYIDGVVGSNLSYALDLAQINTIPLV